MGPYLAALAITLAVEIPLVALVFAGQRARMAGVCAVTTTATHVAMHFALPFVTSSYDQLVLVGELGALVIEAAVYALASRPRDPGRALVASAVANAASYVVGLAVF